MILRSPGEAGKSGRLTGGQSFFVRSHGDEEIGTGVQILNRNVARDDVSVTIEKVRLVTLKVFPSHGYIKTFCIDGKSAVEQIEKQGPRIYYQKLVQAIRACMVEGCEQARECTIDDLPAFVKAAVAIARQNGLGPSHSKTQDRR